MPQQIILLLQFGPQECHQHICIHTSFMSFIKDNYTEVFLDHHFSDSHSISHKHYFCVLVSLLLKPNRVAHLFTQTYTQLLTNSLCKSNGTDSTGLSNHYLRIFFLIKQILRDLGGFSRSSFATYYSDWYGPNHLYNLLFMFMNWESRPFNFHKLSLNVIVGISLLQAFIINHIPIIELVTQYQPSTMLKKIQQQTKTIEYIKKKFKERTGEDVVMPLSWEDYLNIDSAEAPAQNLPVLKHEEKQQKNFRLAIDELQLPSRINATRTPLTSFSSNNKFHMVEYINLSGFRDNGFSKQLLREFVSRIAQMRALSSVSLKGNGIDQSCAEQIQSLLSLKRITHIDLSSNKMGKACLQIISKSFQHLEWVDLSRNYFLFESHAIQGLLNSIRTNGKIWHVCLDLQDEKQAYTLTTYLKIKPQLHSLGLIDSHINMEAMSLICKVLEQSSSSSSKQIKQSPRLVSLNLQNCYLKTGVLGILFKALSLNSTLISLNLNSNSLGEGKAINLCKVIRSNISIINLGLANNWLEDQFAEQLAICLQKNQVIQNVDISRNNIGEEGGLTILNCLSTKNDTLESLGEFSTNKRMGQKVIQKIKKVLKINKVSKELRAKIIAEEGELSAIEISNRQTEAFLDAEYNDYDLLVPIAVSNPLRDNFDEVHIWNFDA